VDINQYIFRGRSFKEEEIRLIQEIIEKNYSRGRKAIARIICESLNWRQHNGRLKIVSCLEALRRMNALGLLSLPPQSPQGGYRPMKLISEEEVGFKPPEREITGSVGDMGRIHFELVKTEKEERLWRYLIQSYHYLGYRRVVGRYLKYFIYLGDELVGLIGFSDGLYHHHLREGFLGWSRKELESKRHLVVNNFRFLIFPWVRVKNLGSKILSEVVDVLKEDWRRIYGYSPIAIETFVDSEMFSGAVYRASNWICLGKTEGKGRRGLSYFFHGRVRHYYIYPLNKGFKQYEM